MTTDMWPERNAESLEYRLDTHDPPGMKAPSGQQGKNNEKYLDNLYSINAFVSPTHGSFSFYRWF